MASVDRSLYDFMSVCHYKFDSCISYHFRYITLKTIMTVTSKSRLWVTCHANLCAIYISLQSTDPGLFLATVTVGLSSSAASTHMIYQTAKFSMTLHDPCPQFQGHVIL